MCSGFKTANDGFWTTRTSFHCSERHLDHISELILSSELRDDINAKWSPEAIADAVKPYIIAQGINTVSMMVKLTVVTFSFIDTTRS